MQLPPRFVSWSGVFWAMKLDCFFVVRGILTTQEKKGNRNKVRDAWVEESILGMINAML
jgi:hypothetical protein